MEDSEQKKYSVNIKKFRNKVWLAMMLNKN